jgi:hypothetical protein
MSRNLSVVYRQTDRLASPYTRHYRCSIHSGIGGGGRKGRRGTTFFSRGERKCVHLELFWVPLCHRWLKNAQIFLKQAVWDYFVLILDTFRFDGFFLLNTRIF